jgi:hypothetical protein
MQERDVEVEVEVEVEAEVEVLQKDTFEKQRTARARILASPVSIQTWLPISFPMYNIEKVK